MMLQDIFGHKDFQSQPLIFNFLLHSFFSFLFIIFQSCMSKKKIKLSFNFQLIGIIQLCTDLILNSRRSVHFLRFCLQILHHTVKS